MESEVVSLKNSQPISKETAEQQFQTLLDWYDIDETDTEDSEGIDAAFQKSRGKLIRAIQKGKIEIKKETDANGDETLVAYQYLDKPLEGITPDEKNDHGKTIRYKEVTGRSKTAIKDEKKTGNFSKLYQYLGSLSGYGPRPFLEMKGKDNSYAECLCYFFLLV